MDLVSIGGVILALLAVVGGNYLDGGELDQLFNLPAVLIVIGGTFAAALVQSPSQDFKRGLSLIGWAFGRNQLDFEEGIMRIVGWCATARRKGLLGLEAEIEQQDDPFIKSGLQLLVDGRSVEVIRSSLEAELVTREYRDIQGAKVIEGMGGYAPTLGIIGAVLGLIHVMSNLDSPDELGAGIATAFVATIYGVGIANLFFLPVANKIRSLVQQRFHYHEMMLEGLLFIAEGQSPRIIQQRLQGYLS